MNCRFGFALASAALAVFSSWGGNRVLDEHDASYYRMTGKGETFAMVMAQLSDDVAKKRAFWERVSKDAYPVIYQLAFMRPKDWKDKLPSLDEAIRQVDFWFASDADVKTEPERIFAVTLCEENVPWNGQLEVQDKLARHLRERYGVKTYQWLTEPLKPTFEMQADGWAMDAYCIVDPTAFYSHLESFILTGKPVVPCIWASGHFCRYHPNRSWDALARFTVERMDMCRALGLPVMVFAVGGKMGSVGLWFKKAEDAGEECYRSVIRSYLAAVPNLPRSTWPAPEKKWIVRVGRDGMVSGCVDLRSFELVRETMFDDVRRWRLSKAGLELVAESGSLSWRLQAQGRVTDGVLTVRHSPGAKGTLCGKALSADGVTRVELEGFRSRVVTFVAEGPVILESAGFEGKGEFEDEVVELAMDTADGHTDYHAVCVFDDQREYGLKSEKGFVAKRRVVQKILLPGCSGELLAEASVIAPGSLGASVTLSYSLDGREPVASVSSERRNGQQDLSLKHLMRQGVHEVYCIWDLVVSNGVSTSTAPQAQVKGCRFRFRPHSP